MWLSPFTGTQALSFKSKTAYRSESRGGVQRGVSKILKQELVGEYGTELAIIDNNAYQVIRVRNLRGASDEYPRFKVVIRESAAGIVVRYRQAGYHAGDPKRQTIRREDPDGAGRIVEIVRAAIQAERKRLIEFRQQEG